MAKDKKGKKGKGGEVRENPRNWVPDEGARSRKFDTGRSQGREPYYSDLPGLQNSGWFDREKDKKPYASDHEGRQYEYVVRQSMPQSGKFKDGEGNKYQETWQYVGQTPEETVYRGDDSFRQGGDDIWQRVITPSQKKKSKQQGGTAPAPTSSTGGAPAGTPASTGLPPASSYIQPGPTTTQVTPGQQFLNDYMNQAPYQPDLSSAYAPYYAGDSAFSSEATTLQPIGTYDELAWYDQPY